MLNMFLDFKNGLIYSLGEKQCKPIVKSKENEIYKITRDGSGINGRN